MCFASQTPSLCSASLFSSLPLFARVCLFAGVLRLANHDVAQWRLSFAPLGFCSLIRSLSFMVIFGFAYFALQASGLRGAFTPLPGTCMISLFLSFPLFCVFEYFASQLVFVESFSRCLPITSRSLLVCLIRSSLASQTTVLCGTSFPLYFSFCVLICLYCFRTFFVLPIWRAYLWPLSCAIPLTPIFSWLF